MMNRTLGILVTSVSLLPTFAAETPVQLPPFNSIEAYDGAHVTLRHGPTQRVTIVKGSLDYSRVVVSREGALVVRKCNEKCPRGYELDVEIVVPSLRSISLTHSGRIQTVGSFPRQDNLVVAVAHGGMIDVRLMPAGRVTASVDNGGSILTVPETSLSATVAQGGNITYWGNAEVKSSVEHGGVVVKGSAAEFNLPVGEPPRRHSGRSDHEL
jgi:hypothetical protein